MRPLIYYVACTLDGYIAFEDGGWEWMPEELRKGDQVDDFLASYEWFDAVLMGRKTYDVGLRMGVTCPYPTMKQFVFSRSMAESPDENVELIAGDAVLRVKELKAAPGKAIWHCGGGQLAATLFDAGLIDQIILKLNPVLLGSRIPLFSRGIKRTDLELADHKLYGNGIARLRYRVMNG